MSEYWWRIWLTQWQAIAIHLNGGDKGFIAWVNDGKPLFVSRHEAWSYYNCRA